MLWWLTLILAINLCGETELWWLTLIIAMSLCGETVLWWLTLILAINLCGETVLWWLNYNISYHINLCGGTVLWWPTLILAMNLCGETVLWWLTLILAMNLCGETVLWWLTLILAINLCGETVLTLYSCSHFLLPSGSSGSYIVVLVSPAVNSVPVSLATYILHICIYVHVYQCLFGNLHCNILSTMCSNVKLHLDIGSSISLTLLVWGYDCWSTKKYSLFFW